MRSESVLILVDDKTKRLYTLAVATSSHQDAGQENSPLSRLSPCYVAFGAVCEWTYLVLTTFST